MEVEVYAMWKKVICDKCNSELEYEDKSVWEGNREREQVCCPVCVNEVASVFTDLIPQVRVVKRGDNP